jgi:hypothetical protein
MSFRPFLFHFFPLRFFRSLRSSESDREESLHEALKNGKQIQTTNSTNNMQYMQRTIMLIQNIQQPGYVLRM